ncbi:MAG: hypothetical protein WC499_03430 [Patescibacteria group bacterium]
MEKSFLVLILDDEFHLHEIWKKMIDKRIKILHAYTIEQAEELFKANQDKIDAMAIDACIQSGFVPNTPTLVAKIRGTFEFKGPMIAISGNPDFGEKLKEVGCDHKSAKLDLPQMILKVLGLVQSPKP